MSKSFGFTGFKLKPTASSNNSSNSKLQKLYPLPSGLKSSGHKINVISGTQKKQKWNTKKNTKFCIRIRRNMYLNQKK